MAAVYSVTMRNVTIIANATLVIIHAASATSSRASSVEILRAWAGQVGTDTTDQVEIELAQKVTAFGTYVSSTPGSHSLNAPVSGIVGGTAGAAGTCGVNASAEGAGTVTPIIEDCFSNLNGWLWVPTPEERILMPPDTAVILKIIGTPASLTGWSAGLTYRELS
jgi:hypothetical protein